MRSPHYNLPVDRAAMEWARKAVLALDPADLSPAAVTFLIRSYVADGGDAVRDAAELGLTRGLASAPPSDTCIRLEWLRTLVEAAPLSDDERLRDIVTQTLPAAVDALEGLVGADARAESGGCCADVFTCRPTNRAAVSPANPSESARRNQNGWDICLREND